MTESPVEIVGFSSTFTFEKAYQKMIAGDLALAVSSTITTGEVVITASPIESMKFGQVEGEVLFGVVQFGNTSDEYADSSFTSSSDPSTFRIVATSGLASSGATRAVCALVKLSGEGGGEVEVKTPLWKDDERITGMMSVEFCTEDDAKIDAFMKQLKYVHYAPTLGGMRTTMSHPVTSSHFSMPDAERRKIGITPGMIRLSVGLEDPDDLIADFSNALKVFG